MNDLVIMIQIAGRRCALDALEVQSVIEIGKITPVPRSPDFITGITALRSQALTVVDTRRAIGLEDADWESDTQAVVVEVDGYAYALIVDAIEDISTAMSEASEIAGGFGPQWSRVARGMIETASGPALLIDLDGLITGRNGSTDEPCGQLSSAA